MSGDNGYITYKYAMGRRWLRLLLVKDFRADGLHENLSHAGYISDRNIKTLWRHWFLREKDIAYARAVFDTAMHAYKMGVIIHKPKLNVIDNVLLPLECSERVPQEEWKPAPFLMRNIHFEDGVEWGGYDFCGECEPEQKWDDVVARRIATTEYIQNNLRAQEAMAISAHL